jgi:pimeloyl-ACP methyl ester carboxylesterase
MPYIQTTDHTRLFYTEGGQGAPIVFVAGAWLDSRMWEFQLPSLVDQGCRCIAYDRRGHGRSDCSWDGYDYDTLADDLATLLNHLDLHGVLLVSHSAGAGEIVRYLARHGDGRVARIAIVAGTTPFAMQTPDNPQGVPAPLVAADMAVRTSDRAKWLADHADGFFGVGLPGIEVSPERRQYMISQCLDCSARATAQFFWTGFSSDLRGQLHSIALPALIVHGDHDLQAPLDLCGRRTAQLLPNSRLIVYENAAHGLFVTHADRLNTDLAAFATAFRSRQIGAAVGV